MQLYHDPDRHFIHTPSSFIAITFDLDLQNIGKVATNIFWNLLVKMNSLIYNNLDLQIYNEDKSEVYVLLFESIRNENSAFVDVCYIVI